MVDKNVIEALSKKHQCPIWVTKNGELIPVTMMSDRHLQNAHRAICRAIVSGENAYTSIYSLLNPDTMAFVYAENEADHWYEEVYPELLHSKSVLENEIKRRNNE